MKQTRREFIKVFTLSGTGLLLAAYTPLKVFGNSEDNPKIFSPSVFLKIDDNGIVTVVVQRSELGQGVRTALPMLIAEELEVDVNKIKVEQADGHPKYGDQTTGGSQSIRRTYDPFRIAGATARVMLISAAAAKWRINVSKCRAENGFVINNANGEKLSYGELVEDAAKLPVPENVPLKDPKDFKLIGKKIPRKDSPEKIYGSAKFGFDLVIPGMYYAALERCPVFGGKVKSFDDAEAKKINGITQVVQISNGVAVIGNSTWSTFKAKKALKIEWDLGANANVNTETLRNDLLKHLPEEGSALEVKGDPSVESEDNIKLEAVYEVPYLAHAPMEPNVCIADVRNGKAELWASSQSPQTLRTDVARALGLTDDDVTIHVNLVGGAFGRKLVSDYGVEAAEISKTSGKIIKLCWTREDDIKHSVYRPASMHKLSGSVSIEGKAVRFSHHVIAESILAQRYYRELPVDRWELGEGTRGLEYQFPYSRISATMVPTIVPVSWYRSVYHNQNPFAVECFIDEMAVAAKKDPYEFRKAMLPDDSRLKAVLVAAAEKAGWGTKLPEGSGRGIACATCYDSFVAHVAEVTVKNNRLKVDRLVIAIDCGVVVNPDGVISQLEGAAGFALSAVLKSEITFRNGGVVENNYDDYEILTLDEMPKVEVVIIKNTFKVGGIGETGIATLAPSVCNAVFNATGKRIRRLPVKL